jgi:hypothetical protein
MWRVGDSHRGGGKLGDNGGLGDGFHTLGPERRRHGERGGDSGAPRGGEEGESSLTSGQRLASSCPEPTSAGGATAHTAWACFRQGRRDRGG